jgi:hypothetical protein
MRFEAWGWRGVKGTKPKHKVILIGMKSLNERN